MLIKAKAFRFENINGWCSSVLLHYSLILPDFTHETNRWFY